METSDCHRAIMNQGVSYSSPLCNRMRLAAVALVALAAVGTARANYTEAQGRQLMARLSREYAIWAHRSSLATWAYLTDLNNDTASEYKANVSELFAEFDRQRIAELSQYPYTTFTNSSLKRMFELHNNLGTSALSSAKLAKYNEIVDYMISNFTLTTVSKWQPNGEQGNVTEATITLDDLKDIFASGFNDSAMLKHYWKEWHDKLGRQLKPLYVEYVKLANEVAQLNNYSDNAAYWISDYETPNLVEEIYRICKQLQPLYKQLHAYVRHNLARLLNKPGRVVVPPKGDLPAHILGNLWAQEWTNIYNVTAPFPNKASIDVTSALVAQNYTVLKMVKLAEEFYTSLNLSAMTDSFWNKSILVKPSDKEIDCQASWWTFFDGEDYRIKVCSSVNMNYLRIIHDLMGNVEYYLQYKNQPYIFQAVANPGFMEVVGETCLLSVSTAKHYKKIGLLDSSYEEDCDKDINSLYQTALEILPFLPFIGALELWRFEVFRGNITSAQYNSRYWQLRHELQGIAPPVKRSKKDFDAGVKYHVAADSQMINYYLGFILQFQIHKVLCIKANQYDPKDPAANPLHRCDIYQSTEAGNALREMLQLGTSKPWQDALELLTGVRKLDAGPMLEYFKPLQDWLEKENKRTGAPVGWTSASYVNE